MPSVYINRKERVLLSFLSQVIREKEDREHPPLSFTSWDEVKEVRNGLREKIRRAENRE